MLSTEEEKFLKYWEENREPHSSFMSKLIRGLPMAMVFGLPILLLIVVVYFLSPEWYTKVSAALAGSVSIIVIAVFIAILFYAFIRMHFKWEMNDQLYRELKQKSRRAPKAAGAMPAGEDKPVTFEEIIAQHTTTLTEDGLLLEHEFKSWDAFQLTPKRRDHLLTSIFCSYVHEPEPYTLGGEVLQGLLVPNRQIPIPTAEQKKALEFLFSNEYLLRKNITDYIFKEYNRLRIEEEEPADSDYMPEIEGSNGLMPLMELSEIYVLANSREGTSYIGFYFNCRWDVEHGLGLLTHAGNVVQSGQSDEARDEYFKMN